MIPTTWTQREFDILESLCCRVRVLSGEQLRRGWLPHADSVNTVAKGVARLLDAGLLQSMVWSVKIPRIGNGPLHRWEPPMPTPEFKAVARLVRTRWPHCESRVDVYLATPISARLFGSSADKLPPMHHRGHDLLLGAALAHYRVAHPDHARRWMGEDAFPLSERGIKNPDAFLVNDAGQPYRAIESAGRYSAAQIEMFHHYCQQVELPYELW